MDFHYGKMDRSRVFRPAGPGNRRLRRSCVASGVPAGACPRLFGCSLTGVLILRHAGQNALSRLRAQQRSRRIAVFQTEGGALLTALGAVLLIIPGFITSVLATPLLLPPLRRWIARGIGRWSAPGLRSGGQGWTVNPPRAERERAGSDIIDLTPGEWRQVPPAGDDRPPAGAVQPEAETIIGADFLWQGGACVSHCAERSAQFSLV